MTPPAAPQSLEAELRAVAARLKDVSKLLASEFGDDDLDKDQIKADLATLTRAAATIARMREAQANNEAVKILTETNDRFAKYVMRCGKLEKALARIILAYDGNNTDNEDERADAVRGAVDLARTALGEKAGSE